MAKKDKQAKPNKVYCVGTAVFDAGVELEHYNDYTVVAQDAAGAIEVAKKLFLDERDEYATSVTLVATLSA